MISCLAIESLTCTRGSRTLFRDLSISIGAGELLAIEGPNGAGKTSLLRLVAGFLAPATGRVRIGEIEDAEERGKFVGWLGHHDALKSQFTAGEQLEFYAKLYGVKFQTHLLEKVGLARQRELPCRYLSAGQKKRLALARLLLVARPLWLLDEPFAALDAEGRVFATGLIAAHIGSGGIALVATHERLSGRAITLGAP